MAPFFSTALANRPDRSFFRHPIVYLKDMEPADLDRLLQFMYYGEVKVPHAEMENFIVAAANLSVRGLAGVGQQGRKEGRTLRVYPKRGSRTPKRDIRIRI